jgi:hypothetical protein
LVQSVSGVAISEGCGLDPAAEAALAAAIEKDIESRTEGWRRVTRLYRHRNPARALLVARSRAGYWPTMT